MSNATRQFLNDLGTASARHLAAALADALPNRDLALVFHSATLSLERLEAGEVDSFQDRDLAAFIFRYVRDNWNGTVTGGKGHDEMGALECWVKFSHA